MFDPKGLYVRLPVPLQNLACSLEGWRLQRTRFGSSFQALLQEVEARAFLPSEQIREYRDWQLRAFIQHSVHTVPFYQRWFGEFGVSPDDVRSVDDLKRLPILTKETVQEI